MLLRLLLDRAGQLGELLAAVAGVRPVLGLVVVLVPRLGHADLAAWVVRYVQGLVIGQPCVGCR